MNKQKFVKDYVLPLAIAVIGVVLTLSLSPNGWLIHPAFDVDLDRDTNIDKINISNTGWIQGKNVKISIPLDTNSLASYDCPEGELSDSKARLEFNLKRMSTNLNCQISIKSVYHVSKVIVTADDTPAHIWTQSENKTTVTSLISDYGRNLTVGMIMLIIIFSAVKIIREIF